MGRIQQEPGPKIETHESWDVMGLPGWLGITWNWLQDPGAALCANPSWVGVSTCGTVIRCLWTISNQTLVTPKSNHLLDPSDPIVDNCWYATFQLKCCASCPFNIKHILYVRWICSTLTVLNGNKGQSRSCTFNLLRSYGPSTSQSHWAEIWFRTFLLVAEARMKQLGNHATTQDGNARTMWRVPYPATSTQCLAHQFAPDVPFFNAIGQCNQCCWSRAKGSITPGDVTIEVETSAAPWMWQLGCELRAHIEGILWKSLVGYIF